MYQQSSSQVITLLSSLAEWLFDVVNLFVVAPQFGALINNLIMTTDQLIMGSCSVSTTTRSSSQGMKLRISPAPLVWSVALRASRNITIQATIEYIQVVYLQTLILFICLVLRIGRSREYIEPTHEPIFTYYFPLGYWRNLWLSFDFAGRPLKTCVKILHVDICRIWNLYDKALVSPSQLPCCFEC